MNSEPKLYEIYLVLKNESEESLANTIEEIKKYVETKNGRSLGESRLTKRRLAYPIGKEREGFFSNLKFFLKPGDLAELEEKLKKDSRIIRYLITRPSPRAETRAPLKRIKRAPEKKAADLTEIDKKLEEILGA